MKKKYRVTATMYVDLYIDIEASSVDEAISIAESADGGDWDEEDIGGDFKIDSVFEYDKTGDYHEV